MRDRRICPSNISLIWFRRRSGQCWIRNLADVTPDAPEWKSQILARPRFPNHILTEVLVTVNQVMAVTLKAQEVTSAGPGLKTLAQPPHSWLLKIRPTKERQYWKAVTFYNQTLTVSSFWSNYFTKGGQGSQTTWGNLFKHLCAHIGRKIRTSSNMR